MKFLTKLFGFFATIAILAAVATFVFDSTLLNSEFLKSTAASGDFYRDFTKAVPEFIVANPEASVEDKARADVLAAVLTPGYIKGKFENYFEQLEEYYRQDGPAPDVGFDDLPVLAQQQGFQLDQGIEGLKLGAPVKGEVGRGFIEQVNSIKLVAGLLAVLLLVLTAVTAAPGHRLTRPAKPIFVAAILIVIFAFLLRPILDILGGLLTGDEKLAAVAPAIKSLVQNFHAGIAIQLLKAAGVLIGLAIILIIAEHVLKIRTRRLQKPLRTPKGKGKKKKKDEGGLIPQG